MLTKNMKIGISTGVEPRLIAVLVQNASQYESSIYIEVGTKKINAKSIMGMMTLVLNEGEEIVISANGNDEEEAVECLKEYLKASTI